MQVIDEFTNCPRLPLVALTKVRKFVALVEFAVTATFTVLVAPKFATVVVDATVNGAVPVATVEVITPVALMVVNLPVVAVVAPTVPLMLIEAVPVKFVTVPLLGVPKTPPLTTKALAEPTLTAKAVATPVPSPVMEPTAGVTVVLPARVNWPCALTVNVPTWVAEPYAPAATAVLLMLNCVPVRVRPVPAE